ncbi:MAG: signal peptidase I [Candidatus Ranarchaeia archaeon]
MAINTDSQASSSGESNKSTRLTRENVFILILIGSVIVGPFLARNVMNVVLRSDLPVVVVTSESMVPTIQVGDLGIIVGFQPEEITIGSIIVFQATWRPDTYPPVIHRVTNISIDAGGVHWFTTKGDNSDTNPLPDPSPCPENRVYGVAVIIIPKLGLFALWLQSGLNYFLVVGVVGVLLVITLIYDFDKNPKEDLNRDSTVEG